MFFFNPASNSTQTSYLRLFNTSSIEQQISILGTDDSAAQSAPLQLRLAANASLMLSASDLENGATSKGLTGKLGNGQGKWRLLLDGAENVEISSLVIAPGGLISDLSGLANKRVDSTIDIFFFNPASNLEKQSFLRIYNNTNSAGTVQIAAIDDAGTPGASELTLTLSPNEAASLNAIDLEMGNIEKNLQGALGDGTGKWRLKISSTLDIDAQSLVRISNGNLFNLSEIVE